MQRPGSFTLGEGAQVFILRGIWMGFGACVSWYEKPYPDWISNPGPYSTQRVPVLQCYIKKMKYRHILVQ
jgi:hypothetical protein